MSTGEMTFDDAMIAVAPAYRLEGQRGVYVRSRTTLEGVYFVAEHDGAPIVCGCQGFVHHGHCWHLGAAEKAQLWEDAARLLHLVFTDRGCDDPIKMVVDTWASVQQDCTKVSRSGKKTLNVLEAMETFAVVARVTR